MDCFQCGHENNANAKFCSECGTPVVRGCTQCGSELTPAAKFCDQCGTPVAAIAPAEPATPPASDDTAVRKTVTVMFCDLVGSTAFAERVDPEAAREVMGGYHAMARAVIESHGGTVAKFIGDGVMALWGVPEVAEDDAERSVACGLELQREFLAIASQVQGRYGAVVGLRVGINTGEVVIADEDDDIVGAGWRGHVASHADSSEL